MTDPKKIDRWARLRFAIIGPLLAAPPPKGELGQALEALAKKKWQHPVTGVDTTFGFATLERWYYAARKAQDPVAKLRRRRRHDAGHVRRLALPLCQAIKQQYRAHPGWTVQLHSDLNNHIRHVLLKLLNDKLKTLLSDKIGHSYFWAVAYAIDLYELHLSNLR